jgi:hypothetical protein
MEKREEKQRGKIQGTLKLGFGQNGCTLTEREENGKASDPQSTSRSLTTTTREDVQPSMKAPKVRKTDEEAVGLPGGR